MDCGWTLWKYYSGYLSSALAECTDLSTEPTGTLRCSTTLTDSYSIDTNIEGCSHLGNCPTTTSSSTSSAEISSATVISSSSTVVSSSTSVTASTSSSTLATTSALSSISSLSTSARSSPAGPSSVRPSESLTSSSSVELSAIESSTELATSFASANVSSSAPTLSESLPASSSSQESPESAVPGLSSIVFPSSKTFSPSSSSDSSSSKTTPDLLGVLIDGVPEWRLTVPGVLGPWSSVSLSASKIGDFLYDNAIVSVNGQEIPAQTIVTNDSVEVTVELAIGEADILTITYGGEVKSGRTVTSKATLTVFTSDRLMKRSPIFFNLESTINVDGSFGESSISSESNSSTSSSAVTTSFISDISSTISSQESPINPAKSSSVKIRSTPITTEQKDRTTIVTITSCSENKCSEKVVTTGVSIVTSTINNRVSTYTTYCPIEAISSSQVSEGHGSNAVSATTNSQLYTTKAIISFYTTSIGSGDMTSNASIKATNTVDFQGSAAGSRETLTVQSTSAVISTFQGMANTVSVGFVSFIGLLLI